MARPTRVPYHQNVYDLLALEPQVWTEADELVSAHEAEHGPLPAAVREWFTVPNVVPLRYDDGPDWWRAWAGTLWFEYSNEDQVPSVEQVLRSFAAVPRTPGRPFVPVHGENQGCVTWWAAVDGSDDPPVWVDNDRPEEPAEWTLIADRFTDFVWQWIAYYHALDFTPVSAWRTRDRGEPVVVSKPHAGGTWACSPAAPFPVPVLDYLPEQFGEPERAPARNGVTRYSYRTPGGVIRLTTDYPANPNPHAAWWVYAMTPGEFGRLTDALAPWGCPPPPIRRPIDISQPISLWGK